MTQETNVLPQAPSSLGFPERFYLWLNQFFPRPPHPFDQLAGEKLNYSQFEYDSAPQVFALYQGLIEPDFYLNQEIIDLACGGGGKTIYLLEKGAKSVVGIDKMPIFIAQAEEFAASKGLRAKSSFLVADSASLPFPDASFDLVILNDAMEHVDDPQKTLVEAARVLRPQGRIMINFEPYYHPRGGHVSDVVAIPWEHVFFSEKSRIKAYKHLVNKFHDAAERIAFRIGQRDGKEAFTYVNHLTISRFKQYFQQLSEQLELRHYRLLPFQKPILRQLIHLPLLQEFFTKNLVCILQRRPNLKSLF